MISHNSTRFTVLFENPFWIWVLERHNMEGYSAAKITFGAEPSNNEIYHLLLKDVHGLQFSKPQNIATEAIETVNPKRRKRAAQKELQNKKLVSKAHETIKMMQEQNKVISKEARKHRQGDIKQQRFELKQLKKKQKHKGR